MLISGGSPGPRQWDEFAQTVLHLVRRFSKRLEVDVMMSPGPQTPQFMHELADAGVHGVALNMELYSSAASQLHVRAKHRQARPYLEATLDAASSRLGRDGRVRSLIIAGLEPVEETLAGIAQIAAAGADPVISPFRPAVGTRLVEHPPCDVDELRAVLDGARTVVRQQGAKLGPRCLPCQHNTLTFPWDVKCNAAN
jgi:biotin synthase-like enzyme